MVIVVYQLVLQVHVVVMVKVVTPKATITLLVKLVHSVIHLLKPLMVHGMMLVVVGFVILTHTSVLLLQMVSIGKTVDQSFHVFVERSNFVLPLIYQKSEEVFIGKLVYKF
jgi:hypothetical protein